MPFPKTETKDKECESCHKMFNRNRYSNGQLESPAKFKERRLCKDCSVWGKKKAASAPEPKPLLNQQLGEPKEPYVGPPRYRHRVKLCPIHGSRVGTFGCTSCNLAKKGRRSLSHR